MTDDKDLPTVANAKTVREQIEGVVRVLGLKCDWEEIWDSNSHGELWHVWELIAFARAIEESDDPDLRAHVSRLGAFVEEDMRARQRAADKREGIVYQHLLGEMKARAVGMIDRRSTDA